MHTGERQAAKMRMAYLKSMLNQDISLFDTEASTGEVISAITSDIIVVQDALSEKVGILSSISLLLPCISCQEIVQKLIPWSISILTSFSFILVFLASSIYLVKWMVFINHHYSPLHLFSGQLLVYGWSLPQTSKRNNFF